MLKRNIFLLKFGATSSWQRMPCQFSHLIYRPFPPKMNSSEYNHGQPSKSTPRLALLSCCKRLMFKLKSSNRGQPGHAIRNNIRWKKARGQTSTWVCSRRERRRRRSACSEFGIESFLSHRKLPIQAVTYSGGRDGCGFLPTLTQPEADGCPRVTSSETPILMHDLVLAELPPPKELRYTQNGDLNESVITLSGN